MLIGSLLEAKQESVLTFGMEVDDTVESLDYELDNEDEEGSTGTRRMSKSKSKAREHKEQLQRLQEKDPEFFQFLKEHDQELLEFDDEDIEESADSDIEGGETVLDDEIRDGDLSFEEKPLKNIVTAEMVDSWCKAIKESGKVGAIRSLTRAFRWASHYGDDEGGDSSARLGTMSSGVFNKIMIFVLTEMDGILRKLLKLPASGGKKETIKDLMGTRQWKNYNHMVKSYLGNALHILNQMTDTEMISFTLRRLKCSTLLLAALPSLLRRYIKVALHFWGTGGGALPVVSFLFLRDLCVRIGSDCLDECYKGVYKAYVLNCQFVNATKLQRIQFLGNCVIELLGVDLATAYQHAFIFIRQLGMILREALTMKTKEAFRKVYEWKFINCLELWTGAVCAYSSEADFQPLAYPLTQIILGVARLVPTARYFPLRLRCVRMLNRIAAVTATFIPVSMLLLDMLEMKELNRAATGGVGKAVDLRTILKEACVYAVVEELAEHLAQWSYSIAFFELSFIPSVRLRGFCKSTKVERFRKEMRQLICQIDANSDFTNRRRTSISFLPNDPAASLFFEDEKKSGTSPLSQYVATLRQRAKQRSDALMQSSVLVGEKSSVFGEQMSDSDGGDDAINEQGAAVFSSSWLPGSDSKVKPPPKAEEGGSKKKKKKKKRSTEQVEGLASDEDILEDLVLSSDEDEEMRDSPFSEKNGNSKKELPAKQKTKKWKASMKRSKKNAESQGKNSKKRKKAT